ncbi:glycosyltransferase family 4 protein [Hymenobacter sp. BT559]|uniref:glycosyltransferase family 4 protein n=1 Tax=Hymenobacter sp. BT559 TaxID=2795729 RepID=UPI0018EC2093|nr:glycosyltransferase [Hymenobacter sp. BT559]MBJ6144324.1 glycosyltransferase [Hymenobacter sp. BT559]
MKAVLSHPTGNRNVRAILASLLAADQLAEFDTTLAISPQAAWLRLLPGGLRQEWLRRTYEVPAHQCHSHPFRELSRLLLPKLGVRSPLRHEQGWASMDAVYQDFDTAVAHRLGSLQTRHGADTVYAYEDGALATFTRAKALGMRCVYDLPIAYWETGRQLMQEEAARLPQWAPTLGGGIQDSPAKLARKTKELELADVVVTPSLFVRDSLPAWAREKPTIMVPFGSPTSTTATLPTAAQRASRPLRVLFVGALGQRKGLGDLMAAVKQLDRPDLELVLLGTPLAPLEFYRQQLPQLTYEPGRPHDQVLALMRTCDVFCLPSIVEGRALVMQEAMSQGLPLLITPNTGGEDLIEEGRTGFLVPIRSPEAIAEKLNWFLDNRSAIPEMGRLAQQLAARYTWESYGTQVFTGLTELASNHLATT